MIKALTQVPLIAHHRKVRKAEEDRS